MIGNRSVREDFTGKVKVMVMSVLGERAFLTKKANAKALRQKHA